jgi:hypothetical protein
MGRNFSVLEAAGRTGKAGSEDLETLLRVLDGRTASDLIRTGQYLWTRHLIKRRMHKTFEPTEFHHILLRRYHLSDTNRPKCCTTCKKAG